MDNVKIKNTTRRLLTLNGPLGKDKKPASIYFLPGEVKVLKQSQVDCVDVQKYLKLGKLTAVESDTGDTSRSSGSKKKKSAGGGR